MKEKALLWSGLDKFGDVYAMVDWDKGPVGQYIHNTCMLTFSNAKKLEQAKNDRIKKRLMNPNLIPHLFLRFVSQLWLHLPSGCGQVWE